MVGGDADRWLRPIIVYYKKYLVRTFLDDRGWQRGVFRPGLRMGFSNLEFLGQIASLECCFRGAAPTPLALPFAFPTWPGTRLDA